MASKVCRRLEKRRGNQENLWDDNENDNEFEAYVRPKPIISNKTYIVLSDSDEEKARSRSVTRSKKLRRKTVDSCNTETCSTCLICSILTSLSAQNCCSNHLSLLTHQKHSNGSSITKESVWPPKQVMIIPIDDELIQRYLNPEQIHRLKTPMASTDQPSNDEILSTKSIHESDTIQHSTKSLNLHEDIESRCPMMMSSIDGESVTPTIDSNVTPVDTTFTIATSTSSTTTNNSFESPSMLDTCQVQSSSDQPSIANRSDDDFHEFTPATARRTPTDLMVSCLPRIQLKKGRYRLGKPIVENDGSTGVHHETRCSSIITSSTNMKSLATIVEDESLILPSNGSTQNKTVPMPNDPNDNMTEELSDTAMSCLLAQEEQS